MPKIKELKNLGLNSHNTEAVYEQLKGIVPQTYINHDSRDVIDGFLFIISEMIAETKSEQTAISIIRPAKEMGFSIDTKKLMFKKGSLIQA